MFRRWRCEMGWHSYTYWQMGTSTRWEGMKPKEVSHQERECIFCRWKQIKVIVDN